MFEAENIRDWRTHDVLDPTGAKIGQLEAIYVDTSTDRPSFASVRIGIIGRHRLTFVPLDRATVAPWHLRVAYPKSKSGTRSRSAPTESWPRPTSRGCSSTTAWPTSRAQAESAGWPAT